jgi:hypothetical protein
MRIFFCDHCRNPVFFENIQCLRCGHALAFLPDQADISALKWNEELALWESAGTLSAAGKYRLCQNYAQENVCNWAIPADDPSPFCRSCRLTRTIPDLSLPNSREAWFALETAKRRLVYSLLELGLPVIPKADVDDGIAFEFLADFPTALPGAPRSTTGHADGVITINVAEADDAERERRRLTMHEPYRTLLGHFRHESGHYYWDRLIRNSERLAGFRELFGDERPDYVQALDRYHLQGPALDWPERFVSAYASAHPWEDWAETWAHYLHMTDALETASECGLALRPRGPEIPAARPRFSLRTAYQTPCDEIVSDWLALAFVMNNLSRGLGQKDLYPFVLTPCAIKKLAFIHETCAWSRRAALKRPAPPPQND